MTTGKLNSQDYKLTIIYLRDGGIISVNIQDHQSEKKYILHFYDNLLSFREKQPRETRTLSIELLNTFIKEKQIKLFL